MSESRKPLLIGSFLLSGLFLLVVGTLLLSRDSWFSQPSEYVVYFKGALDGLDVGADVTYRGVKVGSVREIRLSYDRNIKDVVMPVILRIDPRQATSKRSFDQVLEQLVQRGLRAQLQTPSLLTGKAIVALDIFPDTPGYVREQNELELPAITSVPSRIDQAANLLNDLVAEIRELPPSPEWSTIRAETPWRNRAHSCIASADTRKLAASDAARPVTSAVRLV